MKGTFRVMPGSLLLLLVLLFVWIDGQRSTHLHIG